MPDFSNVAVILPTWNSEAFFDSFSAPLLMQGIRPDQVLVVDSESKDRTVARARECGFRVHEIPRTEYNHGGTRALAATLCDWAEFLVYTTPDAIMERPDTLAKLLAVFEDSSIAAAYGRQLPHTNADIFARCACATNYPATSLLRTYEMRKTLGFKSIFFSDNLGAYRRSALESVGSFPRRIITAEDTIVAAKFMLAEWKIAYVADAAVYHSHNQTLSQLFRRYFDTGVMHEMEGWIREKYGEPSGDGVRFLRAEIARVSEENVALVPMMFLRTIAKYTGYQLGRRHSRLPLGIKRRIGNFREFWQD
jgi:rhamnosyltransferase